jgi:hypothetical protein
MHKAVVPILTVAIALTGCADDQAATPTAASTAKAPAAPSPKPAPAAAGQAAGAEMTIADVFAQKDSLAGKPVTVSGKVVKFSANIMGANWIHVQDGTGSTGTNDLTVTTAAVVAVGDSVRVSGPITRNKDFGAGYKYDVIIENARVDKQ